MIPSRPASFCQLPFASRNTSQPGMAPPKVRQVSPGGHGAALQSCDEVSEQRMRWLTAGCTGLIGFRMSMAVTWS